MKHSNVTLVIAATERSELDFEAVATSVSQFDPAKVLIFSDSEEGWRNLPIVKISKFKSSLDYANFMLRDLAGFIDTDFVLNVQFDGFILNGGQFSPHFYHYDYLGAPWPWFPHFRVGNSGFAWRSKKLLEATSQLVREQTASGGDQSLDDDVFTCRFNRVVLEERYGIQFAGEEMASHFSVEGGSRRFPTFGFHGVWHLPSVYSHRLDWLLSNVPRRTVTNENTFRLLYQEVSRVSPAHGEKLKQMRVSMSLV